jgi:hypothetical protein
MVHQLNTRFQAEFPCIFLRVAKLTDSLLARQQALRIASGHTDRPTSLHARLNSSHNIINAETSGSIIEGEPRAIIPLKMWKINTAKKLAVRIPDEVN